MLVEVVEHAYGPIMAIGFDREHGAMPGGAGDTADDCGTAW